MSDKPIEGEMVPVEDTPIAPQAIKGLAPLVKAALMGVDPEQIKAMLEIQKEYEKNEARKAFYVALAKFKKSAIEITKDSSTNFRHKDGGGQTSYSWASLAAVMNAVTPLLSKHGLFLNWRTEQEKGMVTVICHLSHAEGHSEQTSLSAGADNSGKKNPIQQVASTVSYLERYTALTILGLATKDQDDDGQGAGTSGEASPFLTDEQQEEIQGMLKDAGINPERLNKYIEADTMLKHAIDLTSVRQTAFGYLKRLVSDKIRDAKRRTT